MNGSLEKNCSVCLDNVKTAPGKLHFEIDQGFIGNHDLVGWRYLLQSHEAKSQLVLHVYFGRKSLWVSNRKW